MIICSQNGVGFSCKYFFDCKYFSYYLVSGWLILSPIDSVVNFLSFRFGISNKYVSVTWNGNIFCSHIYRSDKTAQNDVLNIHAALKHTIFSF